MKVLKDLVKILQKEKHDLIQKFEESEQQLQDSKSDLRLLREQLGYYTKDSYIKIYFK